MQTVIGILVLLHALAHAGAGMWAAGRANPWIVTPLWLIATGGYLLAAYGILGLGRVRPWNRVVAFTAAAASMLLAGLVGSPAVAVGALIANGGVLALRGRWVRTAAAPGTRLTSAHPRRRLVGASLAYLALAYVLVVIATRPWYMTWGTTTADRDASLPGDSLQAIDGRYRIDHAITINASPEVVWGFLAQLGQDRGGFYSYAWLERAIGDDIRNADSIVPEWGKRQVGDLVRAAQPNYLGGLFGENLGWQIQQFDPPSALVLKSWGSFVVLPLPDGSGSRLYARTRGDGRPTLSAVPFAPLGLLVFEPSHFIMQRGMLRGIKQRSEAVSGTLGKSPSD
jgi:hypothetical protein